MEYSALDADRRGLRRRGDRTRSSLSLSCYIQRTVHVPCEQRTFAFQLSHGALRLRDKIVVVKQTSDGGRVRERGEYDLLRCTRREIVMVL